MALIGRQLIITMLYLDRESQKERIKRLIENNAPDWAIKTEKQVLKYLDEQIEHFQKSRRPAKVN